jgi:hypothetical protein
VLILGVPAERVLVPAFCSGPQSERSTSRPGRLLGPIAGPRRYGLRAADGKPIWSFGSRVRVTDPVVTGDVV